MTKHTFLATVAALAVSSTVALAQAVVFTPDADVKVKTIIKPAPAASLSAPVAVGTVLPPTVELQPLPAEVDVSYRPYRYITWNNRVVLVEPGTRKVVRIID